MRSNRLIRIWPQLEPELRKVAIYLCRYHPYIDHRDLMEEGVLAIKRTRTTKKRPHSLTYLIKRAKYQMKRFLFHDATHIRQGIPLDDILDFLA